MNKEKEIADFFNVTTQTAKDTFRALGTFNLGMCFMLSRDKGIIQIPVPIGVGLSKDTLAMLIKGMVEMTKPLAIAFITEAWIKVGGIDDAITKDLISGRKSVSDQPDKGECIIIVQETPESCEGVIIPIFKGDKGTYYGEEISNPNITGRFTNFYRS
jgi:hypothetical protein